MLAHSRNDNHILTCVKWKAHTAGGDHDLLFGRVHNYNTMLRIRGQKGKERYALLIDEQLLVGWDNLLRGKFTKQWRIYQKA